MSSLIDPRLGAALQDVFYPSTVTIEEAVATRTPLGQPISDWLPAPDFEAEMPCAVAPLQAVGGSEQRRDELTVSMDLDVVSIPRYLPTVTNQHRATVDGVARNIRSVDWDSLHTMTRLVVESVSR